MNKTATTSGVRPLQLAAACVTAVISHHSVFAKALREATSIQVGPDAALEKHDWVAIAGQLAKVRDHALRSISALYLAAGEDRAAVAPDIAHNTAQHAHACLAGVMVLSEPLREAVRICAMNGRDPSTGTWPSSWANLSFEIDEMLAQAQSSIEGMEISARREAALIADRSHVYGEGEHEFEVLVTLQTTAHRFIHVRADDIEQSRVTALAAACSEQGAHFVLNEGNFVTQDDVHASAVCDSAGDEVWNDGPDDFGSPSSGMAPA